MILDYEATLLATAISPVNSSSSHDQCPVRGNTQLKSQEIIKLFFLHTEGFAVSGKVNMAEKHWN